MRFDLNKFANEFDKLIDWMVEDNTEVRKKIQKFKDDKRGIAEEPDYPEALKEFVKSLVTRAWYYKLPAGLDEKIDNIIKKYGAKFRTPEVKNDLIGLVKEKAPPKINTWAIDNLQKFLDEYNTIAEFTRKLHDLAVKGKTEVLGEKGRDQYLRDFGYWDRIPMDRHEMRFIIRSGIYHACSAKYKNDPLRRSSLHDALTRFCTTFLKDKIVDDIDLGNAPGIVDIFIWEYCAREGYYVCRSTPECKECRLNSVCLYALTNPP